MGEWETEEYGLSLHYSLSPAEVKEAVLTSRGKAGRGRRGSEEVSLSKTTPRATTDLS